MSLAPRRPRQRRSRAPTQFGRAAATAGPLFPTRIPGVRIAYVGSHSEAAAEMQGYWQSRGASFVHFALDGNAEALELQTILSHADVVFHSAGDATVEFQRELMTVCERAEKPLIVLDESSLSGLTEALCACCPIG